LQASRHKETHRIVNSAPARRLKVAIVAPSLHILGGQAVQADRLLTQWRNDPEVDAWLVPINPRLAGAARRLQELKYVRTVVTQLAYWPLLVRELRHADVVHVFSASYFSFVLSPWPAVRVARALGKPVVFNYHSGEAPDHLQRSALARRTLRAADVNVVPSRFLQEVFAGFRIPALVIPNIVDLRRFQFRERRPLRPHLVSTRNFEPMYNVACTLRAFAIVQSRVPDARLTLAGFGSQDAALRRLASDLGLRHVTFTGRVQPDAMPAVYASGDLYVQTPRIDNMPMSVLEAFASGTPVVSTDVGGVPAMLTDRVHGRLAPDDDHQAVAVSIVELLEHPDHALELARHARSACDAYTWDVTRAQWLSAYRSTLERAEVAGAPVVA
jgi:glycosyltransferase involved in cell wall biosynthesis